jgi:ABC-2 type transport system permease protein
MVHGKYTGKDYGRIVTKLDVLSRHDYYDSAQRAPLPIEELRQVLRYRYLILQLLRRDLLTRYKRSVLGVAWTMLNPLGMMLVLTIAFSQVFVGIEGYSAYVLSGLMAWNLFAQSSNAAIVNLVWGGQMLKRIYIPRTSFALAAIGTGVINTLLSIIPLLIVVLLNGLPVPWTVIFLPIPILLIAMFSLGVGLLLSSFAVYYPDVAEMYKIVLTAWMYMSAIIYPVDILPAWAGRLINLNPMYWLVKLFRSLVYVGEIPPWPDIWPSLLVSTGILVLGWWVFSSRSDEMAYRV